MSRLILFPARTPHGITSAILLVVILCINVYSEIVNANQKESTVIQSTLKTVISSVSSAFSGIKNPRKTLTEITLACVVTGSLLWVSNSISNRKEPVTSVSQPTPAAIAPAPAAIPTPVVNPAPAPVATPKPKTEAEQFQQVVMSHTDGLMALEAVSNMHPRDMLASSPDLISAVRSGVDSGMTLEAVKQAFADQLQIQQGMNAELAKKVAGGLIDGGLAWERGQRPSAQ